MDPISILFKEYDALRSEIQGRTNNGYQLWAIGAAVLTWLVSRPIDSKFWILLALFVLVFSIASWTAFRDINKASVRLRELENQINALAGQHLLEWESRWGSAVRGYFRWGGPSKRP